MDADVAIVGFGPGGEALASLLGRNGHRVVVFERAAQPYGLPRMSTLNGEIARLSQHTGDAAVALRHAIAQHEVELYGVDGQRVGALDWSETTCGYPSHLSLHQPDLETAMAERIATYPNVEVRWNTPVTGIDQRAAGFTLTYETAGEGVRTLSCRYLVGMDGASSFVREALGIELDVVHQHSEQWVLTDFDVLEPLPRDLGRRVYFDMNFEQPYFWGPNGAGRCRTDVRLLTSDDPVGILDHEHGYTFAEQRVGVPRSHLRITRRVLYRFRSQIARSLRVGDAFIGGDAAHAMTPFMGEGACTAMRDAANLAWKLDLVLKGIAPPALLDTYQQERLEHDAQFVYGSLAAWSMINPDDEATARARDDYIRANPAGMTPYIEPLQTGVLYSGGRGGADHAGELAPQGRVRLGDRTALLDDLVGYGFQLVTRIDVTDVLGPDRIARLDALAVARVSLDADPRRGAYTVDDIDSTYRRYFREHHAAALLMRPDFYLFGLAADTARVVDLVDDLLSQLAVSSDEPTIHRR